MRHENYTLRGEVYNLTSKVDEDLLGCIVEVASTLDTYSSHSPHHAVLAFRRQLVFWSSPSAFVNLCCKSFPIMRRVC